MIYIDKNTENLVDLTLLESSITDSINFLFVFKYNGNTSQPLIYINKQPITHIKRYSRFVFNDGDEIGDDFNLIPGQWTYNVYQMPINSVSIDPELGTQIETGRLEVVGILENVDPVYR